MAKARKSVLGDNPFEAKAGGASSGAAARKPTSTKASSKSAPSTKTPKRAARVRPPKAQVQRAKPKVEAPASDTSHEEETKRARAARRRQLAAEVHELESRRAATHGAASAAEWQSGPEMGRAPSFDPPGGSDGGVFGTARELLSSDYYLRQWGRLGMRNRSETVDDFGHDPKYDTRLQPWFDALYERYFRTVTDGIENVPSEGRALIVVNHAGTFPYDGLLLKTALRREHPTQRELRWLAEDHLFYMPFVGSFLNRMGAVRACQENAERLLRQQQLVAVFPEGAKGTGRLYRDRHKLQRFGRGGFVRLCLRTATPVIPCVIVGGEESMPLIFRIEYLANVLGIPYIPVTPTFPALGPLGVVPAPARWSFTFGDPISFDGYDTDAADDHVLVGRLTERVRATMQGMIDRAVQSRRSVWFG